ncbi:MAG: tyrosinase family protein [Xenococcus sp. (in: cyanobacteria)]
MVQDNRDFTGFSRRSFLVGAGGLALASALPSGFALAQTTPVRRNLSNASEVLGLYKIAIEAMLALPPTDPRNWYRYALIHTLDCPHGNWWFLPWHRAYIGWFEQICRQMLEEKGEDPSKFALPYWDWTAEPYIPDVFFEDYLNPVNDLELWIDDFDTFESRFRNPMEDFFASLSSDQRAQLNVRCASFKRDDEDVTTVALNSADNLFEVIKWTPMFFERPFARILRRECNCFNEPTLTDVSIETVQAALAPTEFEEFGSPRSDHHSETSGFKILEAQPHNHVHNEIGGFMQDNMSPVDPLFFMHHGNIERLWDVWTRKQQPTPPEDTTPSDTAWTDEQFLFYVDANGQPVGQDKDTAGDYSTTDIFGNYTYEPGSGEEEVLPRRLLTSKRQARVFVGDVAAEILDFSNLATSNVALPEGTLKSIVGDNALGHVIAEITIIPPKVTRNLTFNILVNAPEGKRNLGFKSPYFAGSFQFFGHHFHSGKPVTFSIALTKVLKSLRTANKLSRNQPLQVSVVPDTKGVTLDSLESVLQSIKLKFL